MTENELFDQAVVLEQTGHWGEAVRLCTQVLAAAPQHSGAFLLLGMMRTKSGDLANALPLIRRALAIAPDVALGHFYQGMALAGLGHRDEALASYDRAAEIDPRLAEAHHQAGHLLLAANRLDDALAAFDRALAVRLDLVESHGGRAVALALLGRTAEAQVELDGVLATSPDLVWALNLRGKLHLECERFEPALEDCNRSIALSVTHDALVNRATIFRALGRLNDAQADIDRAVALDPNSGKALFLRGLLHADSGRLHAALADSQRVTALVPDNPAALTNVGGMLCALGRVDEALAAYNRVLAIDDKFAKAYFGRGEVWRRLLRNDLAIDDFERAAALDPAMTLEPSQRLHLADLICDWKDRDSRIVDLAQRIRSGEWVNCWNTFSIFDDPELHLLAAQRMAVPATAEPVPRSNAAHARLKIAYLSPDFRDHVLAWQIVELIERHDRTRFEVFGISLVDWPQSPILARLSQAFDHFIAAGSRDDRSTAELVASLEIDIVVDLAGYTDRHKAKIFAYRPAPLAVSYLGHPGTTGSETIDYVLADAVTIPPENERYFSESVARLPDCFFPVDTTMLDLEPGSRAEAGLPESGFVFCAFNNTYKISPQMFDVWMRLVQAVDGCVLWLNTTDEAARANLRRTAHQRGVSPERIIFAKRESSRWCHFARLKLADLFLDCMPYNAHSTATDLLRVGVPVLTCLGRGYAGRVAGSMLTSLGMPELIARNPAEYEAIALGLAHSPERLRALRGKLAQNLLNCSLFDMTRLARQIEQAYEAMWKRHIEGLPPTNITIPSR